MDDHVRIDSKTAPTSVYRTDFEIGLDVGLRTSLRLRPIHLTQFSIVHQISRKAERGPRHVDKITTQQFLTMHIGCQMSLCYGLGNTHPLAKTATPDFIRDGKTWLVRYSTTYFIILLALRHAPDDAIDTKAIARTSLGLMTQQLIIAPDAQGLLILRHLWISDGQQTEFITSDLTPKTEIITEEIAANISHPDAEIAIWQDDKPLYQLSEKNWLIRDWQITVRFDDAGHQFSFSKKQNSRFYHGPRRVKISLSYFGETIDLAKLHEQEGKLRFIVKAVVDGANWIALDLAGLSLSRTRVHIDEASELMVTTMILESLDDNLDINYYHGQRA